MKSISLSISACAILCLTACGKTETEPRVYIPELSIPARGEIKPPNPKEFIEQCLDSLKAAKTSDDLPYFLADYKLDLDPRWRTVHGAFEMREDIFRAVQDTNLLLLIINKNDARYKRKLRKGEYTDHYNRETLPSIIYSNHELAVRRYRQIKKNKDKK